MRSLTLALAACLIALPAAAQDASAAKVFQDAGLVGRWAQDCNRTVDNSNVRFVVAVEADGRVTTRDGGADWESNYTVLEARRIDARDTWMKDRWEETGDVGETVIRREGDHMRVWWYRDHDGKVLVDQGRYTEDGEPNQYYELCGR